MTHALAPLPKGQDLKAAALVCAGRTCKTLTDQLRAKQDLDAARRLARAVPGKKVVLSTNCCNHCDLQHSGP